MPHIYTGAIRLSTGKVFGGGRNLSVEFTPLPKTSPVERLVMSLRRDGMPSLNSFWFRVPEVLWLLSNPERNMSVARLKLHGGVTQLQL